MKPAKSNFYPHCFPLLLVLADLNYVFAVGVDIDLNDLRLHRLTSSIHWFKIKFAPFNARPPPPPFPYCGLRGNSYRLNEELKTESSRH